MVKPWEYSLIGDIFDFKNGLNKEKEFFGYGTPIVNYTDVYKKRALTQTDIKGKVYLEADEIKRFEARQYDVFFTRTSETPEEVGMSSVLLDNIGDCVFSGFVLRARPKNNILFPGYCKYCFSTPEVRSAIILGCTYTTRALTNGKQLSAISIPVPPYPEQELIAEALSDVDNMIISLEKLIAKKKAIKQGAMQELLTGKKRLPGFSGEWDKKTLKQIYETITTGKLDANAADPNGRYRFYTCAKEYSYIDSYAFDGEALLISGNGENVGYIHHYNGKFNAYQRTYVLMGFNCSTHFLKQYLNYYLRVRISLEVAKSNTPYIRKDTISNMDIAIPSLKEQTAIASILSDMDSEIEALEQKLEKSRQIKQGMMQELLTGRIRLV